MADTNNPNSPQESEGCCIPTNPAHPDRTSEKPKLDTAPSFPQEHKAKNVTQIPEDQVDEESMESFPASDPPSHTARPPKRTSQSSE